MVSDSEEAEEARRLAFRDALVAERLLIPTGVPGVFGAGAVFENVLDRLSALITETAMGDGAEIVRFPPVINRADFERSDYLSSFPQLAGTVFSFDGDPSQHARLLAAIHSGADWSEFQKMTEVALTPAACYPVYPMAARRGPIPEGGSLFDVFSYCFRHEPSTDPARMQIFRMREFVWIAGPEAATEWRDRWLERGTLLLESIGLPVRTDLANDPFFGRGGRMLAANQRAQRLKFELLAPICSEAMPTALMSFNYHQDHFAALFGLHDADGGVVHTACVGFGMERIVLALFKTHGFDTRNWPLAAREKLWP